MKFMPMQGLRAKISTADHLDVQIAQLVTAFICKYQDKILHMHPNTPEKV